MLVISVPSACVGARIPLLSYPPFLVFVISIETSWCLDVSAAPALRVVAQYMCP